MGAAHRAALFRSVLRGQQNAAEDEGGAGEAEEFDTLAAVKAQRLETFRSCVGVAQGSPGA